MVAVRSIAVLLLGAALVACDARPSTQVLVHISAERITARRTRAVLVRVANQADPDSPRLEQTVRLQGDGAETSFPLTVPLVPRGGDTSIVYRVEAEAYGEDDRKFNEARVISGYVPDQLRKIRMLLEDQCIEITCRDDQTCHEGDCIDARVEPTETYPRVPMLLSPLAGTALPHTRRPTFRWRTVEHADRYEVQLTNECTAGAITTCAFERTTTATTSDPSYVPPSDLEVAPPVGARWTWCVRACNDGGCSDWSRPRYVDVGRYGHDYDGDGFSDLIVGANGGEMGSAYVYHGGPSGLPTEPTVGPLRPGAMATDFGLTIADADLDGDGYWDVVVSDFEAAASAGDVHVFRGSPSGLALASSETLPAPEPGAIAFGRSVALGDVDGDGFVDIVVGAYFGLAGGTTQGGAVFVFEGAEDGTFRAPPWLSVPSPMPHVGGLFGWAVTAVDLDGDGRDEIAAGAPDQNALEELSGTAWIFSGTSPSPRATLPFDDRNGFLGRAMARAGDLDGDGREDLLVGAPGAGTNVGALFLVSGRADLGMLTLDESFFHPSPVAEAWFAVSIGARGDVDGDGHDEVAVGAYRRTADGRAEEGRAYRPGPADRRSGRGSGVRRRPRALTLAPSVLRSRRTERYVDPESEENARARGARVDSGRTGSCRDLRGPSRRRSPGSARIPGARRRGDHPRRYVPADITLRGDVGRHRGDADRDPRRGRRSAPGLDARLRAARPRHRCSAAPLTRRAQVGQTGSSSTPSGDPAASTPVVGSRSAPRPSLAARARPTNAAAMGTASPASSTPPSHRLFSAAQV